MILNVWVFVSFGVFRDKSHADALSVVLRTRPGLVIHPINLDKVGWQQDILLLGAATDLYLAVGDRGVDALIALGRPRDEFRVASLHRPTAALEEAVRQGLVHRVSVPASTVDRSLVVWQDALLPNLPVLEPVMPSVPKKLIESYDDFRQRPLPGLLDSSSDIVGTPPLLGVVLPRDTVRMDGSVRCFTEASADRLVEMITTFYDPDKYQGVWLHNGPCRGKDDREGREVATHRYRDRRPDEAVDWMTRRIADALHAKHIPYYLMNFALREVGVGRRSEGCYDAMRGAVVLQFPNNPGKPLIILPGESMHIMADARWLPLGSFVFFKPDSMEPEHEVALSACQADGFLVWDPECKVIVGHAQQSSEQSFSAVRSDDATLIVDQILSLIVHHRSSQPSPRPSTSWAGLEEMLQKGNNPGVQ
jgi:hypothetical protein